MLLQRLIVTAAKWMRRRKVFLETKKFLFLFLIATIREEKWKVKFTEEGK